MWPKTVTLLTVFFGLHLSISYATLCPSGITCLTSDTPEICAEKGLYYRENVLFGGCCPGCIALAGFNESCVDVDCQTGYKCNTTEWGDDVCIEDKSQACEWVRKTAKPGFWIPECLADGSYAPRQCKGEELTGRCFCFTPGGERIFGEAQRSEAENMECGCSRQMWHELQKRQDVSLHCNDKGNFEKLQCDQKKCWCAEEITGQPYSSIVPLGMVKTLPCYNIPDNGDQYLRVCDSMRVLASQTQQLLSIHGTNNVYFDPVSCNYDGSFARVQIKNYRKVCVSKDGEPISDYTSGPEETVTCNCEYDKFVSEGGFKYSCEQNGNYVEKQHVGEIVYCVDSDGFNTPCP